MIEIARGNWRYDQSNTKMFVDHKAKILKIRDRSKIPYEDLNRKIREEEERLIPDELKFDWKTAPTTYQLDYVADRAKLFGDSKRLEKRSKRTGNKGRKISG